MEKGELHMNPQHLNFKISLKYRIFVTFENFQMSACEPTVPLPPGGWLTTVSFPASEYTPSPFQQIENPLYGAKPFAD